MRRRSEPDYDVTGSADENVIMSNGLTQRGFVRITNARSVITAINNREAIIEISDASLAKDIFCLYLAHTGVPLRGRISINRAINFVVEDWWSTFILRMYGDLNKHSKHWITGMLRCLQMNRDLVPAVEYLLDQENNSLKIHQMMYELVCGHCAGYGCETTPQPGIATITRGVMGYEPNPIPLVIPQLKCGACHGTGLK